MGFLVELGLYPQFRHAETVRTFRPRVYIYNPRYRAICCMRVIRMSEAIPRVVQVACCTVAM